GWQRKRRPHFCMSILRKRAPVSRPTIARFLAIILLRNNSDLFCGGPPSEGSYWGVGMRILLVEDHKESRKSLQRLIERRGHEVVAVGSAEEAQEELAAGEFSFLILDWM